MRFGSWTFDAQQVRLKRDKPMVNLEDYLPSGTWDVIDAPGIETYSKETNRMELVYYFRIRRKTLFYTVNLIIPTVLISFLSIFVFYLPTDEGEKMTLCISILLALVVFLLLVSKILPPTSMVIPLISKYLIFTLMMNIVTILNTVIIINWNYRTPRTHNMPKWVRIVFIEYFPKILFMKRPETNKNKVRISESKSNLAKDAESSFLRNEDAEASPRLLADKKMLTKNLSLELNETNSCLINANNTNCSSTNLNKIETSLDHHVGATINRSKLYKPPIDSLIKANEMTKSVNSLNSIQNANNSSRPKQQQHKNLDKLFANANKTTANRNQLNNTSLIRNLHTSSSHPNNHTSSENESSHTPRHSRLLNSKQRDNSTILSSSSNNNNNQHLTSNPNISMNENRKI